VRPIARARGVLLALLAVLLAACSLSLIAPYDEHTDVLLTGLHRKVGGILDEMPSVAYADAEPAYASIRADLRTLRARNEARRQNEITVQQLDAIAGAWSELEALHRAAGRLREPVVEIARGTLSQAIQAALRLEIEPSAGHSCHTTGCDSPTLTRRGCSTPPNVNGSISPRGHGVSRTDG